MSTPSVLVRWRVSIRLPKYGCRVARVELNGTPRAALASGPRERGLRNDLRTVRAWWPQAHRSATDVVLPHPLAPVPATSPRDTINVEALAEAGLKLT